MTRPLPRRAARILFGPMLVVAVTAVSQPQELWYGVYLGELSIGSMMFRHQVDATGESFEASARLEVGPNRLINELTMELDRAGVVQQYRSSSDELDDGVESNTRYVIERVGGAHRFELVKKGGSGTNRESGSLTVARGAIAEPLLRVAAVDWPETDGVRSFPVFDPDGDEFWESEARYVGEQDVDVRGYRRLTQAVDVQTNSAGETQRMFVVDGTVVAIHMNEAITAVLGTESEARENLAAVMGADERALRDAVSDIVVGFGSGDPDLIIPHLRMDELQRRWGEERPSVMDLREDAFARYFAQGIREQAEQDNETALAYADLISAAVGVAITGDEARLDFPGASADEALEFRHDADGVWRLYWWSAFIRNRS